MARKLQAEEDARARNAGGSRDAMTDYANTPLPASAQNYGQSQQDLPQREQKKGLFSKLLGKASGSSSSYGQQPHYGGQQYPPQQSYGGYPPQGQYGGYQQQPQYGYQQPAYGGGYQQRPQRTGGGMGAMGGAALGLGGGLIGGMLLEDAIQDHDQNEYDQGCKYIPTPMQCARVI